MIFEVKYLNTDIQGINKKIELKNKYELIVNLLTNDMEEIWKSILNKQ